MEVYQFVGKKLIIACTKVRIKVKVILGKERPTFYKRLIIAKRNIRAIM